MEDIYNLEIEGFGLINEANIEINKINVVGGVNASGKSTASKLLYCFLKANSSDIKEYVLAAILPTMNEFINIMEHPDPHASANLPDKFTVNDNIKKILSSYSNAVKIFKGLDKENYFKIPEDILYDMKHSIDKFIPFLLDKKDTNSYSSIVKSLFKNESLLNFEGKSTFYNDSFKCCVSYEYNDDNNWSIIDRYSELTSKGLSKEDFDDFDENFIYYSEGSFNFLNKIFYIDSISYFDLNYYLNVSTNKDKELFGYKEHVEYILKQLKSYEQEENVSPEVKEKIDYINELISDITQGHIYKISDDLYLDNDSDYYFVPNNSEKEYNVNISSGIQQISLIQIFLDKYKLQPGSFLIMDEPEVNLHPEWQIKFAEILVLLAKKLDINIYLNSHSPMFIEAISLYAQYYDLIDETNFYLTIEQKNKKYNFKKIDSKDMGEVYENLTKPYDELDELKAKILFKE